MPGSTKNGFCQLQYRAHHPPPDTSLLDFMPLVLAPLINLLLAPLMPLVLASPISLLSEIFDISSTENLYSTGSISPDGSGLVATNATSLVVSLVPSVSPAVPRSSTATHGCPCLLTAVVLVSTQCSVCGEVSLHSVRQSKSRMSYPDEVTLFPVLPLVQYNELVSAWATPLPNIVQCLIPLHN